MGPNFPSLSLSLSAARAPPLLLITGLILVSNDIMMGRLLAVLVLHALLVSVLGYSVLPLNKKVGISLEERHENARRTVLSDTPLGGGAGRIGFYYVQMTVGSQVFLVDIVRFR